MYCWQLSNIIYLTQHLLLSITTSSYFHAEDFSDDENHIQPNGNESDDSFDWVPVPPTANLPRNVRRRLGYFVGGSPRADAAARAAAANESDGDDDNDVEMLDAVGGAAAPAQAAAARAAVAANESDDDDDDDMFGGGGGAVAPAQAAVANGGDGNGAPDAAAPNHDHRQRMGGFLNSHNLICVVSCLE